MSDAFPRLRPNDPPAIEVARSLLDYVLRSGEVSVGDRLPPERQFAEAFGVGRSAVREALKSLSLLGLVEIRQGDGTYVASRSSELLPSVIEWGLLLGQERTFEMIEARQHLEELIAGLAATRRNQPSLERLRGHLATMEASTDDPEVFVAADIDFHLEVAHAAGNRVLADVLTSLQSLLRVWIGRVIAEGPDNANLTVQEHVAILTAIEAGDDAGARAAMGRHLREARRRLETSLERDDAEAGGTGGSGADR
ncbi:MAG: FadR/GntR family transcriptional regulator [Actinomycetota bacterium]